MLPVSSSEPATTTSTSPSVKTAPVISVWTPPHVCGVSPAEATMASRPAKAMYAPARKPATSALSQDRPAFVTPVSTPAAAISGGVLYGTSRPFVLTPPRSRRRRHAAPGDGTQESSWSTLVPVEEIAYHSAPKAFRPSPLVWPFLVSLTNV